MMKINKGFTLIEVLITVIILAVGLLGLAGLQISSVRNGLSAEQRAQAAQLVYDMTDRIRSNMADAKLGAASEYKTDPGVDHGCDTSAACSSDFIAQNDLFLWSRDISNALPSGVGTIDVDVDVSGSITYSVAVNWDDDRNGVVDASDAMFTVSFRP